MSLEDIYNGQVGICGPCYYSCTSCSTTCSGGCRGCTSCSSCSGCTSCSGCRGCSGCTGSCSGKCNSGCAGTVAQQAFESLQLGLNEYITNEDLNNIYLVFEAVKNRRLDAGISTSFTTIKFEENKKVTSTDFQNLANNAKNLDISIDDSTISQDEKVLRNTAETFRQKAIDIYPTLFGRP